MSEFYFDILKHYGTIGKKEGIGWQKEVNLVSWRGAEAKIDIREWDASHERMSRGVSLTLDEARELAKVLNKLFEEEQK